MPPPEPLGFADITTTEGTGPVRLQGLITGSTGMCVGNIGMLWYKIVAVDDDGEPTGEWEIGMGRYLSETWDITREDPWANSSNDAGLEGVAPVNFSAGSKYVYLCLPGDFV